MLSVNLNPMIWSWQWAQESLLMPMILRAHWCDRAVNTLMIAAAHHIDVPEGTIPWESTTILIP